MEYEKESAISDSQAHAILESLGQTEDFVPGGDYFLCWDEDNREFLHLHGDDEPVAENTGTRSWSGDYRPAGR